MTVLDVLVDRIVCNLGVAGLMIMHDESESHSYVAFNAHFSAHFDLNLADSILVVGFWLPASMVVSGFGSPQDRQLVSFNIADSHFLDGIDDLFGGNFVDYCRGDAMIDALRTFVSYAEDWFAGRGYKLELLIVGKLHEEFKAIGCGVTSWIDFEIMGSSIVVGYIDFNPHRVRATVFFLVDVNDPGAFASFEGILEGFVSNLAWGPV